MTLNQLIRESQGAVGAQQDGLPGIETWTKIHQRLTARKMDTAPVIVTGEVDARSEKNIATLHPKAQPYARSLIVKAKEKGWNFKITSGLRTYAEQDALYAKRPRVTHAPAGYSNHNFGLAFDVTLFSGSTPVWESPLYASLAAIAEDMGLEWGGNWKTLRDEPHFQLRPSWADGMRESQMLTELRRRKSSGRDFYA
jgi:peptidoglycan LD-endopeptidase CwlK